MLLYKFTPNIEIAKKISIGVFRFYELTKYINMEDILGRSDPDECAVSFPKEEYEQYPDRLPVGSFGGVEFKCINMGNDPEYIKQYFVFCMSTNINEKAIGDSLFAVELYRDNFDLFMQLLNEPYEDKSNPEGLQFFSHGQVDYYDINNHPEPIVGRRWREVYLKHSKFKYQKEYRAALFASDHFFNRTTSKPMIIEKNIYTTDKTLMEFNLNLSLSSGIDEEGWRYIELDISEFAANISSDTNKIIDLNKNP
jgi:hypothetical protein